MNDVTFINHPDSDEILNVGELMNNQDQIEFEEEPIFMVETNTKNEIEEHLIHDDVKMDN